MRVTFHRYIFLLDKLPRIIACMMGTHIFDNYDKVWDLELLGFKKCPYIFGGVGDDSNASIGGEAQCFLYTHMSD